MSESVWLSYAGAITGAVGAITGIAGAVMGYISYRRTQDLKALDLRIELKKAENELRELVRELPTHLEYAKKSRNAVSSATGRLGSGALKKWLAEWETDLASVNSMVSALPASNAAGYQQLNHDALEEKLIDVHAALGAARKLGEKYDKSLAADDLDRNHVR